MELIVSSSNMTVISCVGFHESAWPISVCNRFLAVQIESRESVFVSSVLHYDSVQFDNTRGGCVQNDGSKHVIQIKSASVSSDSQCSSSQRPIRFSG